MGEDYQKIFDEVVLAIVKHFPKVSKNNAVTILWCFEETHGQNDVIAMYKFLEYSQHNALKEELITCTLAHDLNGRNDTTMSPRTSSYLNYEA